MPEHTLPPPQTEQQDVGLSFAWRAVLVVGGTLVLMVSVAAWMFPSSYQRPMVAGPLPASSGPPLQTSPREDMKKFYAEEMQRLNSYGWIDHAKGVAHIPIDVAMRKVAQEGIAGWPSGGKP